MKKDNSDKILKQSLSTLLKRFSSTDVVSEIKKEYAPSVPNNIPLDNIKDSSFLRKARINEQKLNKVMKSITEKGITRPIYVMNKDGGYELLYPRLVYIAAKKCHLSSLPCVLLDLNEEDALLYLASRILQDKDYNIVEMSLIFNKIKKKYKYTQEDIAHAMHLSRSQVTNIMRLKHLPEAILKDVGEGKLSFGHVRAISTLKEDEMIDMVNSIYQNHLSVREVERKVYQLKHHLDFHLEEEKLQEKYPYHLSINAKSITFNFVDEKEKQKFIKTLLKKNK